MISFRGNNNFMSSILSLNSPQTVHLGHSNHWHRHLLGAKHDHFAVSLNSGRMSMHIKHQMLNASVLEPISYAATAQLRQEMQTTVSESAG